jgi:hypothetical protein
MRGLFEKYAQARTRDKNKRLQIGLLSHLGRDVRTLLTLLTFAKPYGIELDTRAQGTSGRADTHLETVAAGHRAAHP